MSHLEFIDFFFDSFDQSQFYFLMLLAKKYSERGCRYIGADTGVLANIPTSIGLVFVEWETVPKLSLQRTISDNEKDKKMYSNVSFRSPFFEYWENCSQRLVYLEK